MGRALHFLSLLPVEPAPFVCRKAALTRLMPRKGALGQSVLKLGLDASSHRSLYDYHLGSHCLVSCLVSDSIPRPTALCNALLSASSKADRVKALEEKLKVMNTAEKPYEDEKESKIIKNAEEVARWDERKKWQKKNSRECHL